jgi:hypothetical protein
MKKITILFFFLTTISFSYAQSKYSYTGAINQKLEIKVSLDYATQSSDDGYFIVLGSYYYVKNAGAGKLSLSGYYDPNTKELILTETNAKGTVTGYFEAIVSENKTIIKGDWVNAPRNKKFPLSLKAE